MKQCSCCKHEMIGNGDSDFCQSCEVYLSNPANLKAWLDSRRPTPLAVDGALVTVNESGEITCKVCGRGMRAKRPATKA